jgi:hypothetical protein
MARSDDAEMARFQKRLHSWDLTGFFQRHRLAIQAMAVLLGALAVLGAVYLVALYFSLQNATSPRPDMPTLPAR